MLNLFIPIISFIVLMIIGLIYKDIKERKILNKIPENDLKNIVKYIKEQKLNKIKKKDLINHLVKYKWNKKIVKIIVKDIYKK